MKKILGLICLLFLLCACGKGAMITNIQPCDLNSVNKLKNPTIVDVRSKEEYESGHIKDSINIPADQIEFLGNENGITKDSVIVVYCQSGARATSAAERLLSMGYKHIYNFAGIGSCKNLDLE